MYELFSINERHPLSWSGHTPRLLGSILRILTAFDFSPENKPIVCLQRKAQQDGYLLRHGLERCTSAQKNSSCLEDNVDARAAALATQIWDTHVSTNHKPQQEPEHNNISQTSGWCNPKKHWKTVTHVALIAKSIFFPCFDSLPVTD